MKTRGYMDLGSIFDELFSAASQFRSEFNKNFNYSGNYGNRYGVSSFDEKTDYYPGFSYPPMNIFLTHDKSLNFEFALAGFEEKNISLSFQGDYMIFSARIEADNAINDAGKDGNSETVHYLKRRLKLKDIDKQKYFVPQDKYDQEKVEAVFKNGILRITIPPKPETERVKGITITIIKEGD